MRFRVRKVLLPLLIIGTGVAVAAVLVATKPKAKAVMVSEKAWLVSARQVSPGAHAPMLPLYGRVESLWSSSLTAGIAADVVEVPVIEGDEVQKGHLLVRLDDRDARLLLAQREAELAEAEARIAAEKIEHEADVDALPRERLLLELAEAELRRARDLVQKKAGSLSTLDTSRQAVERQAISLRAREQVVAGHAASLAELEARRARAEALRDQARLELARTRVTAPFPGRIARVLVSPGKRVRVGDAVIEVYDTTALVVRALLPSRYLPEIRDAIRAGETLRAKGRLEGVAVTARLLRLAGAVEGGSGGLEGLFRIEQGADFLQEGRFVNLDLALPVQEGIIALPHEAIYGTDRVYVVDGDSRLRAIRVLRIGETREGDAGSRVLVRSPDLQPGDLVVTTQLPNAIDGLLVRLAGEK